jgi:ABC-type tungstate transport system substrate-binding protein
VGIVAALSTALGRVIAESRSGHAGGRQHPLEHTGTDHFHRPGNPYGQLSTAIAIGIILLAISFAINMFILTLEKRTFRYDSTIQIT